MFWETLVLGTIILSLGTCVFIMARKTQANQTNFSINDIDLTDLIDQLAKAIGKEIAMQLGNLPKGSSSQQTYQQPYNHFDARDSISMNDSIIPMKIDTSKLEANLEGMAKQEVKVDKDVEKNKSKLADLMKKKKKE